MAYKFHIFLHFLVEICHVLDRNCPLTVLLVLLRNGYRIFSKNQKLKVELLLKSLNYLSCRDLEREQRIFSRIKGHIIFDNMKNICDVIIDGKISNDFISYRCAVAWNSQQNYYLNADQNTLRNEVPFQISSNNFVGKLYFEAVLTLIQKSSLHFKKCNMKPCVTIIELGI
jgi:hypothetical protein